MRILLVGEYSGFHNSLKHGLQELGHEVTLVGDGDGFKDLPVDVFVGSDYYRRNWLREKFKVAWWKLTGRNLEDRLRLARFRESVTHLKNHDIVQFINSNPFGCEPPVERKMLEFLVNNNGKSYLVACGDDYPYADYLVHKHKGYSILDAVKNNPAQKPFLGHSYKYLGKGYRANYEWLVQRCHAVIPSNTDYAMALTEEPKATPIIPAPIVISKFDLEQNKKLDKIQIFMGINRPNYFKKGINYFEAALDKIKATYPEKAEITVAENLPYAEYVKHFSNAHILLDQVLSYDQGYNALEAMLQGKVAFAGAGDKYKQYHQIEVIPAIDAQPDADYLFNQLKRLIENPQHILEIGKEARKHIFSYHDSKLVAQQYLDLYQK